MCVSSSLVCFLHVCAFGRINHAPVESCATVAVSRVGGLRWDVESECLLFAIIVVITASAGISGVCAPAGLIITIPPHCGSPVVNLPYRLLSRISPAVTPLKASSFPFPSVFPLSSLFFSVLRYAVRKCVDVMCVCVCLGVGVSEAGSSDRLCSAFRVLIETYCQSDKRICMCCVFQDGLFFGCSPLC